MKGFTASSDFIVNSTISGNEATDFGGGVSVVAGNVVIRNSTITS